MMWLDLVITLALLQFAVFGILVGRARGLYGVQAPATSGHEMFDRYYRVQMNTMELLVMLVPALWIAGKYWTPSCIAGVGLIYLIGRVLYLRAYLKDPASRTLGFALSFLPIVGLILSILVGIVMTR